MTDRLEAVKGHDSAVVTADSRGAIYSLFILLVSVLALALLAIRLMAGLHPAAQSVLEYADLWICALFAIDFAVSLARAKHRLKYLMTWGWIDLLSCVPTIGVLRLGRLARVFRILRLLRGVRSARTLVVAILRRRAESGALAACLVSLVLVVFSSVAILEVERTSDANIKTAGDAIWWSLVTLTTVGYGDRYPVTLEGRAVAAILMIGGVGLFGTLSGFMATWFLAPTELKTKSELNELRDEVQRLREVLQRMSDH